MSVGRSTPPMTAFPTDLIPKYPDTTSPPPVPVSVTLRSYRKGSSGVHSRALGTGTRRCAPIAPVAVPTTVPPVMTSARTC